MRIVTLVLAAGAGRRLASVTGGVPKQFWRGSAALSLLDETIDRFAPVAPPADTVVVVDAGHRPHLATGGMTRAVGRVVLQPADRGTAAGVLLGLGAVADLDEQAMVAITPADHGVADRAAFTQTVAEAVRHAHRARRIVLVGATATGPSQDYGWILPGEGRADGFRSVAGFVEKPPADLAERLLAAGAVWNTMVVVGPIAALMDLAREHVPDVSRLFDAARARPARERSAFLESSYPSVPVRDFSRDMLTPGRGLDVCMLPPSAGWTDLGTPARLFAWLERTAVPAAPAAAAAATAAA